MTVRLPPSRTGPPKRAALPLLRHLFSRFRTLTPRYRAGTVNRHVIDARWSGTCATTTRTPFLPAPAPSVLRPVHVAQSRGLLRCASTLQILLPPSSLFCLAASRRERASTASCFATGLITPSVPNRSRNRSLDTRRRRAVCHADGPSAFTIETCRVSPPPTRIGTTPFDRIPRRLAEVERARALFHLPQLSPDAQFSFSPAPTPPPLSPSLLRLPWEDASIPIVTLTDGWPIIALSQGSVDSLLAPTGSRVRPPFDGVWLCLPVVPNGSRGCINLSEICSKGVIGEVWRTTTFSRRFRLLRPLPMA